MAKNWYPIINGKCNVCKKCIIVCPQNILCEEKGQIVLKEADKCIDGCKKCREICEVNAITYYDGTSESLLYAFSGVCHHDHH